MPTPHFKKPPASDGLSSMLGKSFEDLIKSDPTQPAPIDEQHIEIDPAKTVMNPLHRRNTEMSGLADLIAGIGASGQLLPALGWRVDNDADREGLPAGTEVVLIYGARRRHACLHLDRPLKVRLIAKPDPNEIIRMMFSENRGRKDYSALELGLEFEAYLKAGTKRTTDELAEALQEDSTKIKRCIQIARLPAEILALYSDPSWLPLTSGVEMSKAITEGKDAAGRLRAKAVQLRDDKHEGDPTPLLMASIKAQPEQTPTPFGKAFYNGVEVGQYRGGSGPKDELRIVISRKAPAEIKAKLLELLASR